MTTIEWARNEDGSEGLSWNALRAEREIVRKGQTITVSANHCEHVNEACRFCYADRTNPRLGGLPFKPGHRKHYRFVVDMRRLLEPQRRKKPTRIFVESMSDAFGEWWPREFTDQQYAVMALTPQHTYINLSKRPKRRREYLDDPDMPGRIGAVAASWDNNCATSQAYTHDRIMDALRAAPLPNVIEGTSVSDQAEADEFVPELLRTRAAVRIVSAEPLLGPIDFAHIAVPDELAGKYAGHGYTFNALEREDDLKLFNAPAHLDGIIVGGESGPNARPMHPDWARSIRGQCAAAGTAYFFKQWGEWIGRDQLGWLAPERNFDACVWRDDMVRVGKANAGRLLDGREHMPVIGQKKEAAAAGSATAEAQAQ